MFSVRMRRFGALSGVAAALAAATLVLPAAADSLSNSDCVVETPTAGAPSTAQPLKLCASFDNSTYRSSEIIKLTVSITNLGAATATHVEFGTLPDDDHDNFALWGGSGGLFGQPSVSIPSGDTFTSEQDGYEADPGVGSVVVKGDALQSGHSYGDPVDISASVSRVVSNYTGVVYVDANGNGKPDAGEGLGQMRVTLHGPYDGVRQNAGLPDVNVITGSDGSFSFTHLPGGLYMITVEPYIVTMDDVVNWPADGSGYVMIDGSPDDTDVAIPAAPRLSDTLKATAAFDQTSYHVGDQANVTFTLTNTGNSAINGIQAGCGHGPDLNQVTGIGKGWEALEGPGIDLAAGQSATVHESDLVPVGAIHASPIAVVADCFFGPNVAHTYNGYPEAKASANATFPTDAAPEFTIKLVDDDPVGGFPDTNVTLLDEATQDPMYESFEVDENGETSVSWLPEGSYDLQLNSGWKVAPGQSPLLSTAGINSDSTIEFHVVPSADQTTGPTSSSPTTTATTGSTTSIGTNGTNSSGELAYTGVNVVPFLLGGLVLVAGGAGVVLFTRRRKATGN